MNQVPDFVAERIKTPANLKYIVEDSTPVVCFGDITKAIALTIGINPSSSEFTKLVEKRRVLLTGSERKLADLKYLGAKETQELSNDQVSQVWQGCLDYFDGPYYKSWFSKMQDTILSPINFSYVDRSAAHLDLIQWATDPLWQDMDDDDPEEAKAHLKADLPFLIKQIETSDAEFIFLSGTPVVESLTELFGLKFVEKTAAEGKSKQNSLYTGSWKNAVVLGTSMNVPDSHTSNAHRNFLSKWIASKF
jgi:hypothetical protein